METKVKQEWMDRHSLDEKLSGVYWNFFLQWYVFPFHCCFKTNSFSTTIVNNKHRILINTSGLLFCTYQSMVHLEPLKLLLVWALTGPLTVASLLICLDDCNAKQFCFYIALCDLLLGLMLLNKLCWLHMDSYQQLKSAILGAKYFFCLDLRFYSDIFLQFRTPLYDFYSIS